MGFTNNKLVDHQFSIENGNIETLFGSSEEGDKIFKFNTNQIKFSQNLWTLQEDIILCEMNSKIGNNWAIIANKLPGRSRIDVKTRFRSILRSKKRYWDEDESYKLLKLHKELSGSWKEIHKRFPNRTINNLKLHLRDLIKAGATWKEIKDDLLNTSTNVILPPMIPSIGSPDQIFYHQPKFLKIISIIDKNKSLDNKSSFSR